MPNLKYFNGNDYVIPKMKIYDEKSKQWVKIKGDSLEDKKFIVGENPVAAVKSFEGASVIRAYDTMINCPRKDVYIMLDNKGFRFKKTSKNVVSADGYSRLYFVSVDKPLYYQENTPIYFNEHSAQCFVSGSGDIIYGLIFRFEGLINSDPRANTNSYFVVKAIKKSTGKLIWEKKYKFSDYHSIFIPNSYSSVSMPIDRKMYPHITTTKDTLKIAFLINQKYRKPAILIDINKNSSVIRMEKCENYLDGGLWKEAIEYGGTDIFGYKVFRTGYYKNKLLVKKIDNYFTLHSGSESSLNGIRIPIIKKDYYLDLTTGTFVTRGMEFKTIFDEKSGRKLSGCTFHKEVDTGIEIVSAYNRKKYLIDKNSYSVKKSVFQKNVTMDFCNGNYGTIDCFYDAGDFGFGGVKNSKYLLFLFMKGSYDLWNVL